MACPLMVSTKEDGHIGRSLGHCGQDPARSLLFLLFHNPCGEWTVMFDHAFSPCWAERLEDREGQKFPSTQIHGLEDTCLRRGICDGCLVNEHVKLPSQ